MAYAVRMDTNDTANGDVNADFSRRVLLHGDEIPPKVAINEGIELGKRFSTQNSGAFINGILDKIKNRAAAAQD